MVGAICLFYMGLHSVWTSLAKQYNGLHSLLAYPIHPWLCGRVTRLTGYRPTGTELYEIHIVPILKQTANEVQAGVIVLHGAKRLTARLRANGASISVVGTTYEGKLANLATTGARRNITETVIKQNVCPYSSKLLYPKKSWDTFVWEIGITT